MPPFGNLYGMDVFADESLAEDKEIAFNAGSHRELVRMKFADFRDLVKPAMIPLAAGKAQTRAPPDRATNRRSDGARIPSPAVRERPSGRRDR